MCYKSFSSYARPFGSWGGCKALYRVATSLKKSLNIMSILEKSLNFSKNFERSLKRPWNLEMVLEVIEFCTQCDASHAYFLELRCYAAFLQNFYRVLSSLKIMTLWTEFRGNPALYDNWFSHCRDHNFQPLQPFENGSWIPDLIVHRYLIGVSDVIKSTQEELDRRTHSGGLRNSLLSQWKKCQRNAGTRKELQQGL